jgi:RNA polymerase sigma factor (sigma-70 family)
MMVETEDIIQTAFGDAFCKLEKFEYRSKGSFLHWVSKIVANKINNKADRYQAMKRGDMYKALQGTAAGAFFAARKGNDAGPVTRAMLSEEESRLYSALDLLDEDKRIILWYSRLEQRNNKDISEILQCSEDTVRMRVRRAERALAQIYAEKGWMQS